MATSESYVPRGTFETVEKLPVYTSLPPGTSESRGLLLLLPDGFGHAKHNLILADKFASDGWRTFLPDYFLGDALSEKLLDRNTDRHSSHEDLEYARSFNLSAWLEKHPHHQVDDLLRGLTERIQKCNANQPVFAIGYCFGGKHAFRLAKWAVKGAAAFHPSFLEADDAIDIVSPLYIGLAEKDSMVPESLEEDIRRWLEEGKVNFTLRRYPDVDHGFASRPNPYDAHAAQQFSKAYQDVMAFFQNHT